MAEGLEAVKHAILEQFMLEHMVEGYEPDTLSSVIAFNAEGRDFSVRVAQEFDDDYASGELRIKLSELGEILRRAKDGKAVVRTGGIFPG